MSRLSQARVAVRPSLKGRMMLAGPSGSGKTRSGLIIATEMAEGARILGVDTEQQSMLTYADDFTFEHLAWAAPFNPRELTAVIAEAADTYAVILVDSLSHFWRAEGGTLDIANGKFTGWKEARPAQEALVDAIIRSGAHVIVTVRSKVEYAQEVENGKNIVKKLGMAAQQDDNLEFEMNVAADLSMDHTATISKSRTTVLAVGRAFGVNRTAEMAQIYLEWLKGGQAPASPADIDALKTAMNGLAAEARRACKAGFVERFGNPDYLPADRLAAARAFVGEHGGFVGEHRRIHVPRDDEPPPDGGGNGNGGGKRAQSPNGGGEGSSAAGGQIVGAAGNGADREASTASPDPTEPAPAPRVRAAAQRLAIAWQTQLPGWDRPARLDAYSAVAGRPVTSGNELTLSELAAAQRAFRRIVAGELELRYESDGTPLLVAVEKDAA